MSAEKRKFKHSEVIMLTSSSTIVENAIIHKTFLISKRSTWADPFFANTKTRIDNLVQTFLGVDSAKTLRNATQAVIAIQTNALESLRLFKVQVEQDFKKTPIRRNEILNTLGFSDYFKDASQNKSQDTLVKLLFQFKKNMDAPLKTEITGRGTDAASIVEIISFADALNASNVNQETYKSNRPVITQQAIKEFNSLYDDVIAIATISAKFFAKDKAIKDTFSYSKLVAAQKAAAKGKKDNGDSPILPTP